MRRWMFLLSLIAALGGSPLRQVEAASDLARSLSEREDRPDLEEVDGGVGDDFGETIKSADAPSISAAIEHAQPIPRFLLHGSSWTCSPSPAGARAVVISGLTDPPFLPPVLQRFLC